MSAEEETLRLYPVQATHIGLRELSIKANEAPDDSVGIAESDYEIFVGHSDYDPEEKEITILIRVEAGHRRKADSDKAATEEAPYHLRVQMVGIFKVNESLFPPDRIYEWANRNSLYIMYPYLREHIYALTARAGFKPTLLPLVEVPLFRIAPTESTESEPRSNEIQPQI